MQAKSIYKERDILLLLPRDGGCCNGMERAEIYKLPELFFIEIFASFSVFSFSERMFFCLNRHNNRSRLVNL